MSEVLALGRIPLDDYAELLGAGEIEELRALATPLLGRSIQMVNSTAVGGGVAEILTRLVPLAEELDRNIKWGAWSGGEDFFEVTREFNKRWLERRNMPSKKTLNFSWPYSRSK